jgi:transaldolase
VTGVTSNPTTFAASVQDHPLDANEVAAVRQVTADPREVILHLAASDVRQACDLFRPDWDRGIGRDGWVSLEVDPALADDSATTLRAAARIRALVQRPNLYVKIPATDDGLIAIEESIAAGHSVNVTLIFSIRRYRDVAKAYLQGLERLVGAGGDPRSVASVASVFVSRIDTAADRRLEQMGRRELLGQLGIATARLAYDAFRELFTSERWAALEAAGASPQWPLWASTSVKAPGVRDVRYVEELVGPHTITTMPLSTLNAVRDHAIVSPSLVRGLDEARAMVSGIEDAGIDPEDLAGTLEREGIDRFLRSYEETIRVLHERFPA